MEPRFVITKGFIKIPSRLLDEKGKVIKKEEGGFVADWEHGRLWAILDMKNNSMIDGDFDLKKLIMRTDEVVAKVKEKGDTSRFEYDIKLVKSQIEELINGDSTDVEAVIQDIIRQAKEQGHEEIK